MFIEVKKVSFINIIIYFRRGRGHWKWKVGMGPWEVARCISIIIYFSRGRGHWKWKVGMGPWEVARCISIIIYFGRGHWKWKGKKKSYDFDQPSGYFFLLNFLYPLYFTNMQIAILLLFFFFLVEVIELLHKFKNHDFGYNFNYFFCVCLKLRTNCKLYL